MDESMFSAASARSANSQMTSKSRASKALTQGRASHVTGNVTIDGIDNDVPIETLLQSKAKLNKRLPLDKKG